MKNGVLMCFLFLPKNAIPVFKIKCIRVSSCFLHFQKGRQLLKPFSSKDKMRSALKEENFFCFKR